MSYTPSSSSNTANTLALRDSSGNFSAGTITASLTGNVSGSSGSCTGNAATATTLQTARAINGTNFDGSAGITVGVNTTSTTTNASFYPLFVSSTTNGNQSVNLSSALTFNPSTNTLTSSGPINSTTSTAATWQSMGVSNTDNSSTSSRASLRTTTGGASAGSPNVIMTVSGVVDWCIGQDNADSNKFKIDRSDTVGGNTKLTIDSSGNVTATGYLACGNFSATSWTPHLQDSSGHDYTMSTQYGRYIQLGNLIHIWGWIVWSGKGSATSTDNVRITNFPAAPTVSRAALAMGNTNGLGITTQCNISSDIDSGNTFAWIWRNVTGTSSQMLVSQTGTSGELMFSGIYF